MPVDFNSNPDIDPTRVESDTPMFAPIRTSKKGEKGSFFSEREPEPRAIPTRAAQTTSIPAAGAPATGERLDESTDTAFATAPIYAGGRTTVKRSSALAPMAVVGGLVLLAGVGAAGWYASQPHDNGVAQLTPGSIETTVTPAPDQLAQAPTPEPAAAPPVNAKPTVTAKAQPAPRPARARAASAAADEGVNASATVPAPARPLTPAPVTPPVNPAPPQAAPAPAPTPVTPPPGDTPLPTQSAPQQSPTPPPTEIPPQ